MLYVPNVCTLVCGLPENSRQQLLKHVPGFATVAAQFQRVTSLGSDRLLEELCNRVADLTNPNKNNCPIMTHQVVAGQKFLELTDVGTAGRCAGTAKMGTDSTRINVADLDLERVDQDIGDQVQETVDRLSEHEDR